MFCSVCNHDIWFMTEFLRKQYYFIAVYCSVVSQLDLGGLKLALAGGFEIPSVHLVAMCTRITTGCAFHMP